ncbi:hypothetical protein AAVH_29407, partial [Aphelenchoides avenae]
MAASTLTAAGLRPSRGEPDEAYNRTARDIVDELRNTWLSHDYSAVIYHSYHSSLTSDVVFHNGSEEDAFNETAKSFKAYVKRYLPDNGLRVSGFWKGVKVDPNTLVELFDAEKPSTTTTERFRKAQRDAKLFDDGGFRAAAVISCAYCFVGYELAWQYFHAYGTT